MHAILQKTLFSAGSVSSAQMCGRRRLLLFYLCAQPADYINRCIWPKQKEYCMFHSLFKESIHRGQIENLIMLFSIVAFI